MNLIPWRNRGGMTRPESARSIVDVMHDDLDRMIERFFEQPFASFSGEPVERLTFAPPVDVEETDKEVTVRAEIPGVDPSRIEVKVVGDTLTLSGSKEETREEKSRNVHRSERRFGSFVRRITLPDTVDADKATADFSSGVLTIRLAKKPESSARTIKVNAK